MSYIKLPNFNDKELRIIRDYWGNSNQTLKTLHLKHNMPESAISRLLSISFNISKEDRALILKPRKTKQIEANTGSTKQSATSVNKP